MGNYSGLPIIFKAQVLLHAVQKCWYCSVKDSSAKSMLVRSPPQERSQKRDDKSKCRIISLMLDYHS